MICGDNMTTTNVMNELENWLEKDKWELLTKDIKAFAIRHNLTIAQLETACLVIKLVDMQKAKK